MPEDLDKSQWTVETLREYILAIIANNDVKTQAMIASNDVKYLERFEASQVAAGIAFTAQQTAMLTALTAQKLAVDTALAAADRAGTKSEIASDKRFEGLNELRGMVTDQQSTFMQRSEATAIFKAIEDKIVVMQTNYNTRHDSLVNEVVTIRETLSAVVGKSTGMNTLWASIIAGGGLLVGIGGIAIAILLR